MALLQDLIKQIDDETLRQRIMAEVDKLTKQKKFGLIFEEHLPECTPLYDVGIRRDSKVALKTGQVSDIYIVRSIDGDKAICEHKTDHAEVEFALGDLVAVAEFGEPIYPYLKSIDTVCNAPDSDLWHTLIEADNYHALQLLEYLYAGKVDCIYIDPACGSGSLLLKFAKILGKENVRNGFYGQEINITTYNLCRINMFLHDINFDDFDIARGDTLTDPQHDAFEPFEAIVSNPPYSIRWAGKENPLLINDPRFAPAGVLAPPSKADFAFILHALAWLAANGTAAIVCFPGIMYRGGAEKKIRQYLIDSNFVDAVIQLPDNLFFGTSIATCIMVLKKSKADTTMLFIDASKECIKVTNNNKLTQENIEHILQMYTDRADVAYTVRLVQGKEIAAEDYNLSVSTYVEPEDTREIIDIAALNAEIHEIVAREEVLRREIDKIIAEIEDEEGIAL